MAFNLGAFAGGLAKGGVDTYTTMKGFQRHDEELAMRKQDAGFRAEQAARERELADRDRDRSQKEVALDLAARDIYGRVGGAEYAPELQRTAGIGAQQAQGLTVNTGAGGADFDRAVAESTQGVLRENAARQGVALPVAKTMAPAAYTEDQANKDYLTRVRAISPREAISAEAAQLGVTAARRTEKYAQQQENALGFNQNVLSDLAKNNGDVGSVLEKHFIPLYNENKLPGVADGGTAKVVKNAVGGGSSIVITDKEGKESVMPADIKTLQMLTGKVQDLMMASSSPENYWKNKQQELEARKTAATETSAGASASNAATSAKELEEKIKAGLFPAQVKSAEATANQANAHAAVYKNMVAMAKEKTEAGNVMKEYVEQYSKLTPEEQQGPKGQQILTEGALAAAKKSGDVTALLAQLRKPDRSVVSAEMEKSAMEEYRGASTKAQIDAVKAKYPGVFSPPTLDQRMAPDLKKGVAVPVAAPAPAPAPAAAPTSATPVNPTPREAADAARNARFEAADAREAALNALNKRAEADPDVRALRAKLADNIRNGDPRLRAGITKEIIDLRKERYGI